MKRELLALLVFWLGYLLPWSNGYIAGVSALLMFGAFIFLCMCIVERFFLNTRGSHRADFERLENIMPLPPQTSQTAAQEKRAGNIDAISQMSDRAFEEELARLTRPPGN